MNGEIEGVVSDEGGGALPGVMVTVTDPETGATRTTVANAAGLYDVKLLPSGTYELSASHDGFQTVVKPGIVVLAGRVITVDLRLEAVEASETIVLTAASPLIETARSSTAAFVGEKEIGALPIEGREFTDLAIGCPRLALA